MSDQKIEKLLTVLRELSDITANVKKSYIMEGNDYMAGYMAGKYDEMNTIIDLFTDDDFFDEYVKML